MINSNCPICDKFLVQLSTSLFACESKNPDRHYYAHKGTFDKEKKHTLIILPFYIEWLEDSEELCVYEELSILHTRNWNIVYSKSNVKYGELSQIYQRFKNLRAFL